MPTWKFYREGGHIEDVELERWQWIAVYDDETVLKQFDDRGRFHQFKEIDQDRLSVFTMTNGSRVFSIPWNKWYKLIHFYRVTVLRAGMPDEVRLKLYCFGYQDGMNKVLIVIDDNDNVSIVDDLDKLKW